MFVVSPLVAILRTNTPRYYLVVLLLKYLVFIIQRCGKNAFFTCGQTFYHWHWRADMLLWGLCLSCPSTWLSHQSNWKTVKWSSSTKVAGNKAQKPCLDSMPFSKGVWNSTTKYCIWIALIQPKYHRVICILSTVYIVRYLDDVLIDMYNSTIFVHFEFCDMYIWVYDNVKIECIQPY